MSEIVDDLIALFPQIESDAIKVLIEQTRDFKVYPNGNQIWASILILSNARLEEVIEILPHAKKDWRDVVVAAGLAVDDWKRVAQNWASSRAGGADEVPLDPGNESSIPQS